MKKKEEIITKLELIAAEAWPAKTMEPFGEWILRANDGVSKRANSLLAIGTIPTDSWLHIYESFYKSYEIEPCVYISEVTPKEVVEKLFAHDYEVVTKMYILTNEVNTVLKQTKRDPTFNVTFEPELTEEWLSNFLKFGKHDELTREAYGTIFSKIKMQKVFVTLWLEGVPVAVATIVADQGWGYICNVVVDEAYRRRGIASQLFFHLATWALQHNAFNLFMQVLQHNEPALQFYNKLNFKYLSESYYLMKNK